KYAVAGARSRCCACDSDFHRMVDVATQAVSSGSSIHARFSHVSSFNELDTAKPTAGEQRRIADQLQPGDCGQHIFEYDVEARDEARHERTRKSAQRRHLRLTQEFVEH